MTTAWRRQLAAWRSVWLCWCAVSILFLGSASAFAAEPAAENGLPQFESDVVPILRAYCWKCHGGEGYAAKLDLRTLPLLLAGGQHGAAIERGSAERSRLYQRVSAGEMPPGKELKPTAAHLETLRLWLDAGSPAAYEGGSLTTDEAPPITDTDREWWSFRPPVRPVLPTVQAADRVATPVDAFLLARLEQRGLTLSAEAERRTLARRLYLDLIGLPPSPAEVEAYVADQRPGAHERLVEHLLASPHYGERWGRHWLDAAGYVDTIGSDNDANIMEERERIWLYRDYVVRAFNQDKPFDQFLLEQLAGDELADWRTAETLTPAMTEHLIATGFLRQAADVTYAPELNTSDIRHQVLFDTVQIVAGNVLGLTLHCAQCHTHKFDPLTQADYYRFAALLAPAYDPQHWKHSKERHLFDVSPPEQARIDARNADLERQMAELQQQVVAARRPFEERLSDAKYALIPAPLQADLRNSLAAAAEKRSELQKYLVDKLGPLVTVSAQEVDQALDEPTRQQLETWAAELAACRAGQRSYQKIQALWEWGQPPRTYLYRRGDHHLPGASVKPGVPVVLDDPARPFTLPAATEVAGSSGYRLALARWLTRPEHPLTARVYVNRVWQHYFGRGIVATPDNFGISGAAPTHPELLDWLARDFVEHGWSIKRLHRLIANSSTYRQAAAVPAAVYERGAAVDPDNELLWRMPLRRLEAEIIRDSMLSVSGWLRTTQGGPPLPLKPNADGSVELDRAKLVRPSDADRRSLYVFSRRNYQLTELNVFDQPLVSHNCTRRVHTAVVLQALALLNGPFAFQQAERVAERVAAHTLEADESARITQAFQFVLCRPPTAEELTLSREFLAAQTARQGGREGDPRVEESSASAALVNLCQMLLNTNEFLYVP